MLTPTPENYYFDLTLAHYKNDPTLIEDKELRETYVQAIAKLKASIRAIKNARCFSEHIGPLIPEPVRAAVAEAKLKISRHGKDNNFFEADPNRNLYFSATTVAANIRRHTLKFSEGNYHNRVSLRFLSGKTLRACYDGASFPVLTLPREERKNVILQGTGVNIDFNSADLRSLLLICGYPQPETDAYVWLATSLGLAIPRAEMKKNFNVWVHAGGNPQLSDFFHRDRLMQNYWTAGVLTIPIWKTMEIECDEEHAFGYMVQASSAIVFLLSLARLIALGKLEKSRILFPLHDSVFIDAHPSELHLSQRWQRFFQMAPNGQNFLASIHESEKWE